MYYICGVTNHSQNKVLMKRNLFWLFLFTCSLSWADNVPVSKAEQLARNFFGIHETTRAGDSMQLEYIWDGEDVQTRVTTSSPAFHVFNRIPEGGFIIIAGDDVASPVLAYSDTGEFEVENMPSNLQGWMQYYREQINWAREQHITPSESVMKLWEQLQRGALADDAEKEVLLKTALWNQNAPYNNLCPKISGSSTPTGCVATALAIVMKYNRWPDQGSGGTCTYTPSIYGSQLSVTYNVPYQWDKMSHVYEIGKYVGTQADAVATLMYHCGVLSQMEYAPNGSGAFTLIAARGMIEYMKYDKSMAVLQREWYTDDEWDALLKQELDEGRLVIYGGSNSKREGHQFVFDGYKANRYHVNWGWGGMANGYYLLSTLEPDQQGIGGNSGGGFSIGQDAVVGIKKAESGSGYRDLLYFFDGTTSSGEAFAGLTTTETDFRLNTSFKVKAGFITNAGLRDFSGIVALALVDKQGKVKQLISDSKNIDLSAMNAAGQISGSGVVFSCKITETLVGGDRIRMVYRAGDNQNDFEWESVKGGSEVSTEILVKEDLTGINHVEQDNIVPVTVIYRDDRIIVKSSVAMTRLMIYDMQGHLLEEAECHGNMEFSLSCKEYIPGIYILRTVTAEGVGSNKFVIK